MLAIVVAKEPLPGRVKTRLCPPLDPVGAAEVAAAALADTLAAVAACGASRRVLALDGAPGARLVVPTGFEVIPQRGDGLAERLAAAWADAGEAGLQIGMDTPQVTPGLLDYALELLDGAVRAGDDVAALGRAADGGWWAIGLTRCAPEVFDGVPMSTPATGAAQRERLVQLGWRVVDLPVLRDIDRAADLAAVAAAAPGTATAAVGRRLLGGGGLG
ncbi:MAG TPA: DUF2064 domain-containing protein [Acidimicrobiales bacterium]|nr:DUF2064 domain-containing protein [Acidimicrobiales bacterium]